MTGILRAATCLWLGLASASVAPAVPADDFAASLDARWTFFDPAASESRFRTLEAELPKDSDAALETATQIARAQGLQRRFDDANATLDRVQRALPGASPRVRVRYLLERGRVLNSSGQPAHAVPLFREAAELAKSAGPAVAFYRVDAMHMLGIAAPEPERLDWNLRALDEAEASDDARARGWRASLLNNLGWTYFDAGDATRALSMWERALAAREASGNATTIRIAKWTVARGFRAVGRHDEAERMQRALLAELERAGETDGYVFEELCELALARGDEAGARPWAAKAHAALRDDASVDAARLARLARIGGVDGGPR